MKFGGVIVRKWSSPEEWAQLAQSAGYKSVYFPVDYTADIHIIDRYVKAADDANLVIAEVGVWNNTMVDDVKERQEAILKCKKQLELADYVGAKCCVNIAGSMSAQWDGPHKDNYSQKTFDRIVEVTQCIVDTVRPKNTFYTLEPMPWMYPDSVESYLDLIKCIDRKEFAVHLDPVNIITSPRIYYSNTEFLIKCFKELGPYIKSIHAKDIILRGNLTVHLDECRPGLGELDYKVFIECANKLDDDIPFMLEHMQEENDYIQATKYIKSIAKSISIEL